MIKVLLDVLGSALSIWETKEKTKYLDKYTALKQAYYVEYNKPDEIRSDAVLDNLEHELCIFASGVSAEIGAKNAKV